MSTNRSPSFPEPSKCTGTAHPTQYAWTAADTPEQQSIVPAQGHTTYPPQRQNFRGTAVPFSNVSSQAPLTHNPSYQTMQGPVHPNPVIQMPQDPRELHTASDPPPMMPQRGETMHITMPDPNQHIQPCRPSPGPYSDYPRNAPTQGMPHSPSQHVSGGLCQLIAQHDPRNQENDEYTDGQRHSRSPPSGGAAGLTNRSESLQSIGNSTYIDPQYQQIQHLASALGVDL